MILSPAQAQAKLAAAKAEYARVIDQPIYDIGFYKADKVDNQQPHARDEAYVIASGSGGFWREGVVTPVAAGNMIFVEAGVAHRFVDFTDDFTAWVFFFGERPR